MSSTKVHCSHCSQEVAVSDKGYILEHRAGKVRCVGSGFNAAQMARHGQTLREIMPGADLAEKFKGKG